MALTDTDGPGAELAACTGGVIKYDLGLPGASWPGHFHFSLLSVVALTAPGATCLCAPAFPH